MKNKTLRILCLCLMLTLLAAAMTPAFAASTKVKDLSPGKWTAIAKNTVYKLVLKNDYEVDLYWKGVAEKEDLAIEVYANKKLTWGAGYWPVESASSASEPVRAILVKGTYYIKPNNYAAFANAKLKVKLKKFKYTTNYSRSRATTLKKDQWVEAFLSASTHYPHWYKINLSKKQKITVIHGDWFDVRIYPANGPRLETVYSPESEEEVTTEAQPKGTYFIMVSDATPLDGNPWEGYFQGFGWH